MRPVYLVDSNVVLDIVKDDPIWVSWSAQALAEASLRGGVAINPIILAEVSVGFSDHDVFEQTISPDRFLRLSLPWEAAWVAGKAFVDYRRRGGVRSSPLPDFYIGAHAQVSGLTLITRDASRYRTYFQGIALIFPDL
jgi:predicted nucleic acid-binding protein